MNSIDCYVMSKDVVTAKWENGKLTVINETLLPLFLKNVDIVLYIIKGYCMKIAIPFVRHYTSVFKKVSKL